MRFGLRACGTCLGGLALTLASAAFAAAADGGSAAAPVNASMPGATAPPSGPSTRPPGYLGPDAIDILAILPPPPEKGDARYAAERRIFRETRKLQGTARWAMAVQDAATSPSDLLRDFSCAVGVELTPDNAPKLLHVAQKATRDTGRAAGLAKVHFGKKRPFQIDAGVTCVPPESVGRSSDYPSGHSVAGWTWALVLAEAEPDRASAILARGRAYGDSRVVCGMHHPSAVEAGRLTASAVMARVAASAEYRADIEAARAELAELRRKGPQPDAQRCAQEAALVPMPVP